MATSVSMHFRLRPWHSDFSWRNSFVSLLQYPQDKKRGTSSLRRDCMRDEQWWSRTRVEENPNLLKAMRCDIQQSQSGVDRRHHHPSADEKSIDAALLSQVFPPSSRPNHNIMQLICSRFTYCSSVFFFQLGKKLLCRFCHELREFGASFLPDLRTHLLMNSSPMRNERGCHDVREFGASFCPTFTHIFV